MSAMEDNNGERGGLLTWYENTAKMIVLGFVGLDKEDYTFGGNVGLYSLQLLPPTRVDFSGLTECSPDAFLDMFTASYAY
jgi:hypothetical protein